MKIITFNKSSLAALVAALTFSSNLLGETDAPTLIIEEDVLYGTPDYWTNLSVLAPIEWTAAAEARFRLSEEKAAGAELEKAADWLKFVAGHALPESKKALTSAANELAEMASALRKGDAVAARDLDQALGKAYHSLAEWHYFKLKDEALVKEEKGYATKHLRAAAAYVREAANSAHYQYGDDFVEFYYDIFGDEEIDITPNYLDESLTLVSGALDNLASALKTPTPTQ